MLLWQTLQTALRALLSNKLRTALTMLGIVIGVAAVVAMLSLGEGTRQDIEGRISSMGANSLRIRPGPARQGPVRGGAVQTLETGDAILSFLSLTNQTHHHTDPTRHRPMRPRIRRPRAPNPRR